MFSSPFPGSLLHQGANTITLQAILEEEKLVPDAGLTYDAVELDRDHERQRARS